MSDIGSRIHRYRLSRYAPPVDRVRRRLRWVWAIGALWLVWIALIGDNSLWRIWKLERENARAHRQLNEMREEVDRLDRQVHDPVLGRELAEKTLRERHGMARPNETIYRVRAGIPDSLAIAQSPRPSSPPAR